MSTETYTVSNTSGALKHVAGYRLNPRSEKELELDEDELSLFEETAHVYAERVDSFECSECGSAFSSEQGLKQHETKSHGGEN